MYSIFWNDITDKGEQIKLETEIKVVNQEKLITDVEENCPNFQPAESNILYHINVYHRSLKILVRGQLKDDWIHKEFVTLNNIVEKIDNKSILDRYNEEFNCTISMEEEDNKNNQNMNDDDGKVEELKEFKNKRN